jgi:hypothetical protein
MISIEKRDHGPTIPEIVQHLCTGRPAMAPNSWENKDLNY